MPAPQLCVPLLEPKPAKDRVGTDGSKQKKHTSHPSPIPKSMAAKTKAKGKGERFYKRSKQNEAPMNKTKDQG